MPFKNKKLVILVVLRAATGFWLGSPLLMRPYLRLWMKWPKSLMTAPSHWMASVRPRQELFYLALSIPTFCQTITRLQVRFKRCWQETFPINLFFKKVGKLKGWICQRHFCRLYRQKRPRSFGPQEFKNYVRRWTCLPLEFFASWRTSMFGGSLKTLGAVQIVGDPCWWIWRVPVTPQDQ